MSRPETLLSNLNQLPDEFILIQDLFIEVHRQLEPDSEYKPQAEFDRVEFVLRSALLTGRLETFLLDQDFDRTPIPALRWQSQEFWTIAHSAPFRWRDSLPSVVIVDRAAGFKAIESSELPAPRANWLDSAPPEFRVMPVFDYLRIIKLWLAKNGGAKIDSIKAIPSFIEKHWPSELGEYTEREAERIASLIARKRPRIAPKRKTTSSGKPTSLK
ncbi:hypothetical protein FNL55_01560 [Tardiphaga sp. vice352]|uniref:hypothetical protein n=1 Tax=Tardiphaga sp. vice352 TaxID=2592816 RepID=UPI001164773C|nr:hypothetical protein [Tardiphaga sp. vice352]QDM30172.1 hypothetical protein FNL55_01560 [Tardiphaga sp. vice352]